MEENKLGNLSCFSFSWILRRKFRPWRPLNNGIRGRTISVAGGNPYSSLSSRLE